MIVKIPLTNQPNQSFTCTIPQAETNISLGFYVFWNRIAEYWQMSLTDIETDTKLIDSLPLVYSGGLYQDILAQYEYLNIGQAVIYPISNNATGSPGETDWDVNFILLWGP